MRVTMAMTATVTADVGIGMRMARRCGIMATSKAEPSSSVHVMVARRLQ